MEIREKKLNDYALIIRDMIRHENEITNNRLTWMLVLQGILFVASASFWRIHWLPLLIITILGVVTSISFFYALLLSRKARIYLRSLWKKKIEKQKELVERIPPVAGDAPIQHRFPTLNPWLFLPWVFVSCWVALFLSRILIGAGS